MSQALALDLSDEDGQCIWYDTCGWDQDYGPDGGNEVHFLNCHYTGPAKPATNDQIDLIKELCPHLYTEGEVGLFFVLCLFIGWNFVLEKECYPSHLSS